MRSFSLSGNFLPSTPPGMGAEMPTKNLKLKDLADVGISGYRSLALWSEELVDPDKPRRPGRKIPLDIWDALALSLAARLGGEGCPMKILRVMVDNLKDNDPGFWHRVQSSKGRSLLAFVRERSGEVDSLGIIDPAQESA